MSAKLTNIGSDLSKVDAHIITAEEYEEIPEVTDAFFEQADLHNNGELIRKGRPMADSQTVLLSVRYSPEVIAYFKATGTGWQKRMDEALKEWIKNRSTKQLDKTDATLDKLAEMYSGVVTDQEVAEEFYYNSLKNNPVLNGITFDFIDKNITRSKGNIEEAYDLLLVNGQEVYIIEVKYRIHPKDIERLVERKLPNFKKLFPEYQHFRIHLALATFAVEEEIKQLALDRGITILQRRGEMIETLAA